MLMNAEVKATTNAKALALVHCNALRGGGGELNEIIFF